MAASLHRAKKLPAFNTFVGVTERRKQTWQEMQAFMRGRFDHEPAHR